jgi:hypothetical protein
MGALLTGLVLSVATGATPPCTLIRPVAPDEQAARRIAEAIIANVPSSAMVRRAKAAGKRYDLTVHADRDDASKWIAFQSPRRDRARPKRNEIIVHFAGHGLGMKIDRCTGAISEMYYQR